MYLGGICGRLSNSANDTYPDGYFILMQGVMCGPKNILEVGCEWASERERMEVYF